MNDKQAGALGSIARGAWWTAKLPFRAALGMTKRVSGYDNWWTARRARNRMLNGNTADAPMSLQPQVDALRNTRQQADVVRRNQIRSERDQAIHALEQQRQTMPQPAWRQAADDINAKYTEGLQGISDEVATANNAYGNAVRTHFENQVRKNNRINRPLQAATAAGIGYGLYRTPDALEAVDNQFGNYGPAIK